MIIKSPSYVLYLKKKRSPPQKKKKNYLPLSLHSFNINVVFHHLQFWNKWL